VQILLLHWTQANNVSTQTHARTHLQGSENMFKRKELPRNIDTELQFSNVKSCSNILSV